ncbi:membrane protein of ER body-like protein isoform X1 [Typha latifolia]|uniref:membrane protein of ER body-like protein isoform X1 n=3 Tax=Typha latifolia TaxID=4733 RepID=UPI003C2BACF4
MEIEREWDGEKEEILEEEKEVGSLEGRQRRRKDDSAGKEINWKSFEGREGEEQRSIYFDSEKGVWKCRHCYWTYQLSGPSRAYIPNHEGYCQMVVEAEPLAEPELFSDSSTKGNEVIDVFVGMEPRVQVKHGNGKNLTYEDDSRTKELSGEENITVEEINYSSTSVVAINGSTLNPSSEAFNDNAIRENVHGLEGNLQTAIVNKSKEAVADFNLEKVLEEQETHDLYCPNCNSCITRRVILRKRKRWIKEIQCDAPAKRIHDGRHDVDSATISTQLVDQSLDREPPDVFRCLSCFSFFIPTEGGFNIFRIFERKEEIPNQQSSPQISERNKNWILSIFQSGSSQKKRSELEQAEDLSLRGWQSTVTVSKAETSNQSPTTMGRNDPVALVSGDSHLSDGEQRANLSKNGKMDLTTTASVNIVGGNESTTVKSIAGDMLPGRSYITCELQESASKDKEAALTQPPVEVATSATHANNSEGKLSSLNLNNNSDFQIPVETIIEVREPVSISGLKIQRENQAGYDTGDDIFRLGGKSNETSYSSVAPVVEALPHSEIQIHEDVQIIEEIQLKVDWDILKAIVYGGLVESITSLSVVSSAAATGTSTLNIFVLGLANLIGGLFLIVHNLFELRDAQDEDVGQTVAQVGRYWMLLGRRGNFRLHAIVAILSYILVGILPPLIYGFSFQKSNNREYKLIAVAAASLLCVAPLAIGKAHVYPQKTYIKTLSYYLGLGITVAGLSYVAGVMLTRLVDKLGLVDQNSSAPAPPSILQVGNSGIPAWATY